MALTAPDPFVFDNSIVVPSTVTSTSSAPTVMPSPQITFKVADKELAQPLKPHPATHSLKNTVIPRKRHVRGDGTGHKHTYIHSIYTVSYTHLRATET